MKPTTPALPALALATAVALAASPALAQPTATLTVTVDGQQSVVVEPGEAVTVSLNISWENAVQLGGLIGDLGVSADRGQGSSFLSLVGAGPLINTGSFVGGSRRGVQIYSMPPLFGIPDPIFTNSPLVPFTYDVTFTPADAGIQQVVWEPDPAWPNLPFRLTPSSAAVTMVPTTYIPATITVTPAPASLALLALAPPCLTTRRRRA